MREENNFMWIFMSTKECKERNKGDNVSKKWKRRTSKMKLNHGLWPTSGLALSLIMESLFSLFEKKKIVATYCNFFFF